MTEHLDLPTPKVRERIARGAPGWPVLCLAILVILLSIAIFISMSSGWTSTKRSWRPVRWFHGVS